MSAQDLTIIHIEISRTSIGEGRRDLRRGHQEKHPAWASMMMGVGMRGGAGDSTLDVLICGS